jgi:hypothetical protein
LGWTEYRDSCGNIGKIKGTFDRIRIDSSHVMYFPDVYNSRSYSSDSPPNVSVFSIENRITGSIYTFDDSGRVVNRDMVPSEKPIGRIIQSTDGGETHLIRDLEPEVWLLTNSKFQQYFSLQQSKGKNLSKFIDDKYLLTSHRLLNQYELFPINGEVAIEMVREQKRLGEVREFTDEEKSGYLIE